MVRGSGSILVLFGPEGLQDQEYTRNFYVLPLLSQKVWKDRGVRDLQRKLDWTSDLNYLSLLCFYLYQTHRFQLFIKMLVFLFFRSLWLECHGRIEEVCVQCASLNLIPIKYSVDGWKKCSGSQLSCFMVNTYIFILYSTLSQHNSAHKACCYIAKDFQCFPWSSARKR